MKIANMVNQDAANKLEPYQRMATAIAEIMEDKGGCLPHDLEERGFTRDEINQHWEMAKTLAGFESGNPIILPKSKRAMK